MKITNLLCYCSLLPSIAFAQDDKPNVIFILIDDMSYGDLGCYNNAIVKSPNLDQLHGESVRMTNFHVGPTSAPTRSGLMTGRDANRVGVWHTVGGRSLLWEDEVTLANVLKDVGYSTALFGKWHLGDNYPFRPHDRGFDKAIYHGGGGITQAPDYWGNDYFDDHYLHNGKFEAFKGYCTDVFFDNAINFIEENKQTPFFCYIAANAAHDPYNVPEEYYNLYEDMDISTMQKRFYGMVTNIDDNLAKLRDKLKQLQISDNTILIFMTDNGTACHSHNAGMRGMKNSEYDGGHKVPFFIHYPQKGLVGGKDISNLTASIDFLPTIAELCGADISNHPKKLDGMSLVPLLQGDSENWPSRTLITDSQRRPNLVKWSKSAVMTDQWRLINGKELYDINKDPSQKSNIASEHPEVVKTLVASYNEWWASLMAEGVNERYAYIKVGSDAENPVRISTHDQHCASVAAHSQEGALLGVNPIGVIKVEVVERGSYKVSLCRYPRESGLRYNSVIKAIPKSIEIDRGMPASKKINFKEAHIHLAQHSKKENIDMNSSETSFNLFLEEGKYDLDACLVDENGVKYPSYFIYIERM